MAALLVAVLAAPALSHSHGHTNTTTPPGQTGSGMNGTTFQVTSITPSQGLSTSGSDIITVTGTGFPLTLGAMTGKTAAQSAATPVQVSSSTMVGWQVPMGIGMGVQISFASGGYTSNTTFNYGAPTVTSLSPALVPQGEAVDITVTGTNLGYPELAPSTFDCSFITGHNTIASAIIGATTVRVGLGVQSSAQSPKAFTANLGSRAATVAAGVTFEVSSSNVAGAKKVKISVQNYVEATFKADMATIAGVASPDQIYIVSVVAAGAGSEMFRVQEYDLRAASTVQFIVLPTTAEPNAETSGLANVEKAAKDGSLASKFPSASGLEVNSKSVTIESNPASATPEGKVSKGWIAAVAVTAAFAFLSIVVVIYRSMQGQGAPKEGMEPTFKSPVVGEPPKEGEGSSSSDSGSIFSRMRGRINNPFRKSAPADAQKTADPAAAQAGGAPMQELRVV